MKKYASIPSVIIVIVLILVLVQNYQRSSSIRSESSKDQTPSLAHYVCTADESRMASTTGIVYSNLALGFSLDLPKGWIVPPQDDSDPHFVNCADQDGFEIHSSNGPEQLFASEYSEYLKPSYSKTIKVYGDAIPEAVVREFVITDPEEAEGWPRTQIILFEKAKKAFFFLSENPIDQYAFVSTFKSLGRTSVSVSASTTENQIKSFSYLFEDKREPNTSNIVGYFGRGAFAWYVPDWLLNNWEMKQFKDQGMEFDPKIRDDIEDFSNITFDVSTSTELLNAENLAYTEQSNIPKDEIITNEVLLNKHAGDMISMQIETDTRIYHITAYTRDFRRITDMYFMDGNGKTLEVVFEARSEFFPQFADRIRDLVEGIGELKPPQG